MQALLMIGTFRTIIVCFDSRILDPLKNTKCLGFGPFQIKNLLKSNFNFVRIFKLNFQISFLGFLNLSRTFSKKYD